MKDDEIEVFIKTIKSSRGSMFNEVEIECRPANKDPLAWCKWLRSGVVIFT